MNLRLVWDMDRRDFEAGTYARLYSGETVVWYGYSNEGAARILTAAGVLFEEVKEHNYPKSCWHDLEED